MPEPRYRQNGIEVFQGNAFHVLPALIEERGPAFAQVTITDPPYLKKTHQGARRLGKTGPEVLVDFHSFTPKQLDRAFALIVQATATWTLATFDLFYALQLQTKAPQWGADLIRIGALVKTNGAPQLSGDRPAQGWEAVAMLHRAGVKKRWNGGGHRGVYYLEEDGGLEYDDHRAVWITRVVRGRKTEKPVALYEQWIELFTNPGDTILDPFTGSGALAQAAQNMGRNAVVIELDETAIPGIIARLNRPPLPFTVDPLPGFEEPAS